VYPKRYVTRVCFTCDDGLTVLLYTAHRETEPCGRQPYERLRLSCCCKGSDETRFKNSSTLIEIELDIDCAAPSGELAHKFMQRLARYCRSEMLRSETAAACAHVTETGVRI
jgi:hypothetical protein